jgi:aspartyl-tRNA(Asn)/glutamyl-tRNA(Gln) amidotransferase subunit C
LNIFYLRPERRELKPHTLSIMRVFGQDIKYHNLYLLIIGKKMALTADDVKKIAYLARLGIDQQDIDSYTTDLKGILGIMQQMGETNTDNVAPMAHPMDQQQRLRADDVTESDNRNNFQAIAPQVEEGLYLVPKVIE